MSSSRWKSSAELPMHPFRTLREVQASGGRVILFRDGVKNHPQKDLTVFGKQYPDTVDVPLF
jgi:hypothetical protein